MFVLGQIGYWKTELSPNDWARSKFQDIPSTCYFALVTMTTVGYGDIYPLSPAGQTFAAIFCTAGVVSRYPIRSVERSSSADRFPGSFDLELLPALCIRGSRASSDSCDV